MQIEDEVGQLVARGSEVDRSFERRIEQWGPGFDEAVLGPCRALLCCELHSGADRLDVGLVKEGRSGQSYDEAFDVGIACFRCIGGDQAWMPASLGAAFEVQGKFWFKAKVQAVSCLVAGREINRFVIC